MSKVTLVLAPLLAAVVLAVAAPALAETRKEYCPGLNLAPDAGCPPSGSSESLYMLKNAGNAGGASHETCVDDDLEAEGYTAAHCMYYGTEGSAETNTPGEPWGYPRVWNGGSVTHGVWATEWGNG